jgi:hypothetical protein
MANKTVELWKKAEGIKTETVVYEGAVHGFCVRGNMKHEKEKENMEKYIDQVIYKRNVTDSRLSGGLICI